MTLHRYANFSSSEIWKLTKKGRGKTEYFGAPALTYIKEKQLELRLGRSLSTETNSKTTNWGTFLEAIAFDKMGLEFSLVSKQRYAHKYVDRWVGMPDILNADLVGDIKCPFTLKAFCEVVDAMSEDNPGEALKSLTGQGETGSHYYWQIVSNAILCDRDVGGLFVYVPYSRISGILSRSKQGVLYSICERFRSSIFD